MTANKKEDALKAVLWDLINEEHELNDERTHEEWVEGVNALIEKYRLKIRDVYLY